VQPISATCAILPLMGDDPGFDPEVDDPCDVQPAYVDQLQEVSFGRQSVARASAVVIDKAYHEAIRNINLAAVAGGATPFRTDPAGRLVLTLPDELTGVLTDKTIDAPLENLGLYRTLMKNGCLTPVTIEREPGVPLTEQVTPEAATLLAASGFGHLICGSASEPAGYLDMFRAAAFYAAAADKANPVTLDEVINVNTYLGVNTVTTGTTGRSRRVVTIQWFNFDVGGVPYTYDRVTTHPPVAGSGSFVLPHQFLVLTDVSPVGSPGTVFQSSLVPLFALSPPGVDLTSVDVQVCRGGVPYKDESGAALACTTGSRECGGANWFTQTAEDARKIIWYLHNWTVPEIGY
jgi:hypothetical protein